MNLIPMPKKIEEYAGALKTKALKLATQVPDKRLGAALKKLPFAEDGVELKIEIEPLDGEGYCLKVEEDSVFISTKGDAGAFYAIQTLRQLFAMDEVPCCFIEDEPDFSHRGFYHDITRGKVPTLETLKKLVDEMAYFKLNSLQLYVEHTYEFKEFADSIERTGYITGEELRALDAYCRENFIELIPSIPTFGHLFELLQKDRYKHLCEVENFESDEFFWADRMGHHTIDPTNDESFELVKSLIDQYAVNFTSDKFNICCDETFDLKIGKHKDLDTARLYIDFVCKIISYVKSKGKTVMMWADILLNHPETIKELPEDVILLNWCYDEDPKEEGAKTISGENRRQIVCPGTSTWLRLCENYTVEVGNICTMAKWGKKYGAEGVLNTNWGDWGNPCSIEHAMFGMVLGAEKSWNEETPVDEAYTNRINSLVYGSPRGVEYLKRLSELCSDVDWYNFSKYYAVLLCNKDYTYVLPTEEKCRDTIRKCCELADDIKADSCLAPNYKEQMLLSTVGTGIMAEILIIRGGGEIERKFSTDEWLDEFSHLWNRDNKKSELDVIVKMFEYMDV